jgi:hypothetical protein
MSEKHEMEITYGTGGGGRENKVLFPWAHRVKILLFLWIYTSSVCKYS